MSEFEEREPVVHEKALTAIVSSSAVVAELSVKRGLNGIRLAVLGILVGIGLTVGLWRPGTDLGRRARGRW